MTVLTAGKATLDYFMRRAVPRLESVRSHAPVQFQTLIKKVESRNKVLPLFGQPLPYPAARATTLPLISALRVSEKLF